MLRYLYRLALPGGRRLVVVCYPPKPELKTVPKPRVSPPGPEFDRSLAQIGLATLIPPDTGLPKALKRP